MYGSEVESILNEQGIDYAIKGNELLIKNCVFCGKQDHLYINRYSGRYSCKKCGEEGGIYTFKQHLGIIASVVGEERKPKEAISPLDIDKQQKAMNAHVSLLRHPERLTQLSEWWGISIDTIKKYKLGICRIDNKVWVSIPTIENGIVYNVKYRSWIGQEKEFRREAGGASLLFNADQIDKMSNDYIALCEGEKDSLTLLDRGYTNVVGNSGGARTFLPEWLKLFDKFEKVIIIFDMDTAGDQGARKLVKRLGLEKCFKIQLPTEGSDVNDYFVKEKHTKEDFDKLIEQARLFEIPGIVTVTEAYMELYNLYKDGALTPDIDTPWPGLNKKLGGGFFNGDLVTISGPPKSLKTHFTYTIAEHIARRGIPVLYYELEMRPAALLRRAVPRIVNTPYMFIDEIDILLAMIEQQSLPIYIGKSTGKLDFQQILETIKAVYKRYGIGLVIVDHVHLFARERDHITQILAQLTMKFKQIANELEIPVMILAQPNKLKDGKRMNYNDIGWTGTFASDSDSIILLQRRRSDEIPKKSIERDLIYSKTGRNIEPDESSFSPVLNVIVDAARQASGGSLHMWFDDKIFTLTEFEDHEEFKEDAESAPPKSKYQDETELQLE